MQEVAPGAALADIGDTRMAVSTADVALQDLRGDPGQRMSVLGESHHLGALRGAVAMIEVKDANVALAAVDARMGEEVPTDQFQSASASLALGRDDSAHMGFAVSGVVVPRGGTVALAAGRLQSIAGLRSAVEFGQWPRLLAAGAPFRLRHLAPVAQRQSS